MDSRARFVGALLYVWVLCQVQRIPTPMQPEHAPVLTARPYRVAPLCLSAASPGRPRTNITLFCCFLVGGWVSDLFSVFSLMFLLIGLFPHSLACPIILWNIQGNVSSCCHFNYYNIPHGSWLSSFWKYFSFFFFFKLSSSRVRPVDFSRASVPSWPQRDVRLWRGSRGAGGMVLERAAKIHPECVESNPCTWI